MTSIINERGFLNDEGKKVVIGFVEETKKLLSYAGTKQELEILSSVLTSLVGNVALEKKIQTK